MDEMVRGHCMRRVISAPAASVMHAFLGLEWAPQTVAQGPMVAVEKAGPGECRLVESIGGHPIITRARVSSMGNGYTEVHIMLCVPASLGFSAVYTIGMDDLWESRLNALTDLVVAQNAWCCPAQRRETSLLNTSDTGKRNENGQGS